jgi:hypothetical protein
MQMLFINEIFFRNLIDFTYLTQEAFLSKLLCINLILPLIGIIVICIIAVFPLIVNKKTDFFNLQHKSAL